MSENLFDWILLLVRWLHITTAVTWVGTSIFFMWLDRSFVFNKESKNEGHVGDLWMVHGGGFYHVEKLLMGPTKVPETLHWFKWESYWTWLSGFTLVVLIFYTGEGTFLLDSTISDISYVKAVLLGLFSLIGSWFFYDFVWERKFTKTSPYIGHLLTLAWFAGMTYYLCHTFSGRAAYIHIGGMLGTWMTANVFMRIIPRQIKMVEATKRGEPVNQDWGINAKNRSTHNTYFTLPVIFIMLSNHFPATYGHEQNWLLLLLISLSGALIREYFVVRLAKPKRAIKALILGMIALITVINLSSDEVNVKTHSEVAQELMPEKPVVAQKKKEVIPKGKASISGAINFEGTYPKGKKLRLPKACAKQFDGDVFSNEVIINKGKLKNVLIRIVKGLEGSDFKDIPKEAAVLDQKGCIYKPRVIGVRVGQKVNFVNSDPIFHNVKSVTKKNKKFNMAMPKKNQVSTRVFKNPEIFLQAKCSVHPWMGAYIAIMDHPFFDVSDNKGLFKIKDIPEGKYTIEVWHEVLGTQTKEVEIMAGKDLKIEFTYKK